MLFTFHPLLLWLGAPRVKVQVKAFTSLLRLFYVCSSRAVYYWIGSYLVRLDFPGTGGQGGQTPRSFVNAWPRVNLQLYRIFSRVCLRAHGCTSSYKNSFSRVCLRAHGCTFPVLHGLRVFSSQAVISEPSAEFTVGTELVHRCCLY